MSVDEAYIAAINGMPRACVFAGAQKQMDMVSSLLIRGETIGWTRDFGGRQSMKEKPVNAIHKARLIMTLNAMVGGLRVSSEPDANAVQKVDLGVSVVWCSRTHHISEMRQSDPILASRHFAAKVDTCFGHIPRMTCPINSGT